MYSKEWVMTRGIFYPAVVEKKKNIKHATGFFKKYCCCFVIFLVTAVYNRLELGFIN